MHRGWWSGSLALGGLLLAMPAGAAGCADDLAARTGGMSVSDTLGAYAACIAELSGRIDQVAAAAPVPTGTVAAFDLTGCPDGWEPFAATQGRVIVGASFGIDSGPGLRTNAAGEPIAEYKYRDHGGIERVTLAVAEMPAHGHAVSFRNTSGIGGTHGHAAAADGGAGSTNSSPAGGGKPHENMPPFIALYFCRKG